MHRLAPAKAFGNAAGPNELICSQANLGYASGNNLGIVHALQSGAPFVLLLNSDAAIAETDTIRLVDRLNNNPDIAILGPVLHERRQGCVQCYAGGKDIAQNVLTRQPPNSRTYLTCRDTLLLTSIMYLAPFSSRAETYSSKSRSSMKNFSSAARSRISANEREIAATGSVWI